MTLEREILCIIHRPQMGTPGLGRKSRAMPAWQSEGPGPAKLAAKSSPAISFATPPYGQRQAKIFM